MDEAMVRNLFERATDTPKEERANFVRAACGNDDAMLRELESLLAGRHRFRLLVKSSATTASWNSSAGEVWALCTARNALTRPSKSVSR